MFTEEGTEALEGAGAWLLVRVLPASPPLLLALPGFSPTHLGLREQGLSCVGIRLPSPNLFLAA